MSYMLGCEPEFDLERVQWVVEGCYGPLHTLFRIVPAVFEGYARILHPGRRHVVVERSLQQTLDKSYFQDAKGADTYEAVSWAEIAQLLGQPLRATMNWPDEESCRANGIPQNLYRPREGIVTDSILDLVLEVANSSEELQNECNIAIWQGFGTDEVCKLRKQGATLINGMAQQGHYILRGNLVEIVESWKRLIASAQSCGYGLTPQAIWPLSREWFYAVPFEMESSFFGGSLEAVNKLVKAPELEAFDLVASEATTATFT